MNTFTSFEADPPITFRSGERMVKPEVEVVPEDGFDEAGNVKKVHTNVGT